MINGGRGRGLGKRGRRKKLLIIYSFTDTVFLVNAGFWEVLEMMVIRAGVGLCRR